MLIEVTENTDFEIVVGLVAPIGTDLDLVCGALCTELRSCSYDAEVVRLSHVLDDGAEHPLPVDPTGDGYYTKRMDAGDALRRRYMSGDAVAARAIAKIRLLREGASPATEISQATRKAWILRTLKHEEEVALLRATYGSRFVLVAVHQAESARRGRLRGELEDQDPGGAGHDAAVSALIERDSLDVRDPLGQRVRETFVLADYFLDADDDLEADVARLVGLLFGKPFITPTPDEVAMYLAHGASLRSADPGRQVGAVITTERGDVLAVGANEVPRAGGGEYWAGDSDDARDFVQGYDFNKRMTERALREFLDLLAKAGHLTSDLAAIPADQRVSALRDSDPDGRLNGSRLMSLIEFGRVVHAEMSAITQAARTGQRLPGATLFTTAFPCHLCMRLIISSGVRRIVYVDPYPKSLALEMHSEALTLAGREDGNRLSVEPFRGAAKSIYPRVFASVNRQRTAKGDFKAWDGTVSRMRLASVDPLLGADEFEAQIPVALVPPGAARPRVESPDPGVSAQDDAVQVSTDEERA